MKKDIHSSIVFLLVFILITACTHGKTAPAKSLDTVKIKQTQSSHFSTSQQVLLKPQLLKKAMLQLQMKRSPLNL